MNEILVPILWDHVQQANDYRAQRRGNYSLTTHCPVALALRAHFPRAYPILVGIECAQVDEELFSIDRDTSREIERWTEEGEFYPRLMLLTHHQGE